MYGEGSWQTEHTFLDGHTTVYYTYDQSVERAINQTLSYLGPTWKRIYGVDMKRTDICGQEGWVPPCTPVWACESPLNGYEADGCGNRRLNPACNPPQGNVSFTSTPPGARIFIDGADQGVVTPNTAMNVPAGDHTYVLKLAGYNDYSGTVSVVTGQTAAVTATLIVACVPVWKCEIPLNGYETDGCGNRRANPACNPPQIGNISFTSTPPGAEIFLDGIDQGVKTPNTVSSIPVGTHAYMLRLAGYNDYTGSIDVTLNQTAAVTASLIAACTPVWNCELPLNGYETDGCSNRRLNPACNPPQTGSISFASTPPGAEIYIDGADQNTKTPATIYDIPIGTHTYTLKQTGYNDVTGTANVGTNQTAVASATLIPVSVPGIGAGTILVLLLTAGALGAVILGSGQKTGISAIPAPRRT